jgi:endonuclease/exonuclease/phosphatase family metal-dependent hydrolase
MRMLVAMMALVSGFIPASAREITLVTWNLGWHMNLAEADVWIAACGQPFALNGTTGLWEPSGGPPSADTKPGWELKWGRDAKIAWDIGKRPPCDVYQANFKIVPVTLAAYEKRVAQIRSLIAGVLDTDVFAFQEVTGEASVRELLPDNGAGYRFCGFSSHAIQRLVVAWKSALGAGVECEVEEALSLPGDPPDKRPRPGLSVVLTIDGKRLRVMTVHLKSSCVSPLEATESNPEKGQLVGNNEHCLILQKQIAPLEAWIEAKATDPTILLGDFNRNLPHELHAIGPDKVRTDGSDPMVPRKAGVLSRSLIGEVNDGMPGGTKLALVDVGCPANAFTAEYCRRAKTEAFTAQELRLLTRWENLGCRNPIGLDHVLVSDGLAAGASAEKVALGKFGGTRPATERFPDPLLAVSDHCPVKVRLSL